MIIKKATKEDIIPCSRVIEKAIANISEDIHSKQAIDTLKGASEIGKLEKEVNRGSLTICISDKTVIGVGAINEMYIDKLFVDPDFQGMGAGKSIMNYLETIAKDSGFPSTYLNSTKNAIPFYEKLGYKKADTNNMEYTFMIKD